MVCDEDKVNDILSRTEPDDTSQKEQNLTLMEQIVKGCPIPVRICYGEIQRRFLHDGDGAENGLQQRPCGNNHNASLHGQVEKKV